MAVAARPGPSDARVPCPLCGGLIHPIAGKCKHCKAELSSYRAARPAASAPLPALHQPAANGHSNGHAERASHPPAHHLHAQAQPPPQAPVPVAAAHDVQTVLPQRPSSRSHTAEPITPAWRSWPVVVIVLAMVAIVAAVVLMLWPAGTANAGDPGKRALQPPPAPEHMQTAPQLKQQRVPHAQGTPRQMPQAGAPDPWASPAPMPQAPDVDDDDAQDPFAMPSVPAPDPGRRSRLGLNAHGTTMMEAMLSHMCRKMTDCLVDDPLVTQPCGHFAGTPTPPPANCPSAVRCLAHIDAMTCGSQPASLAQLGKIVTQFQDCADAIGC